MLHRDGYDAFLNLKPQLRWSSTMSRNEQAWNVSAIEIAEESKRSVTESLFKRMLRKIFPDQRKQERMAAPPLMGYLGTMQGSRPFEVGDVSLGGFSLVTEERWEPGTEMPITLRRSNVGGDKQQDRFTVQATAVRWTEIVWPFQSCYSKKIRMRFRTIPCRCSGRAGRRWDCSSNG